MLTVFVFAAWFLLPGSTLAQEAAPDPDTETLEALLVNTLPSNPELEASWAHVDAMIARVEQVSQPFDPSLTLGLLGVPVKSFSFDEHAMTALQLGIQQRFYWPGTLGAREDEAIALAIAARSVIPEVSIRVWRDAAMHYYRIVGLDRMQVTLAARLDVLQALQDAAEARYEARTVPLADVFRVLTQISRVEQEVLRVSRERAIARAQLNGLLQRHPEAVIETTAPGVIVPVEGDLETWTQRALEQRPAFTSFEAHEDVIAAQRRTADTDSNPQWNVGLTYGARFQDEPVGDDLIGLTLGLSLPFYSSNRTEARAEELDAAMGELNGERQELVRMLRSEIGVHLEALRSLEVEIRALESELIPAVEETYDSLLAHYASSHASVEALIEIQDRLLELHLARAALVSAHDLHRALLRVVTADSSAIREIAWSER